MSDEISTAADELVKLVDEKGKISVKKAAKTLGIDPKKIEDWADFLEKHGALSLKFKFFNLDLVSKKKKVQ